MSHTFCIGLFFILFFKKVGVIMDNKKTKRRAMRLPNGYGSVKKLSGNRRNPWIVTKTNGWEINPDTGKTIQKKIIIGYYPSRQAGIGRI